MSRYQWDEFDKQAAAEGKALQNFPRTKARGKALAKTASAVDAARTRLLNYLVKKHMRKE